MEGRSIWIRDPLRGIDIAESGIRDVSESQERHPEVQPPEPHPEQQQLEPESAASLVQPAPIAHLDALTGLRLVAALMVVGSHIGGHPGGFVPDAFVSTLYSGVTIFFVLSGFVLSHNYFDRFAQGCNGRLLRSYAVARLARVYPLYLAVLLWVGFPQLVRREGSVPLWLEHALALQAWDPSLRRYAIVNPPAWSVSVECFLYGCFPLLVLLLAPRVKSLRGALLTMTVVGATMAAVTGYFVYRGYGSLPWTDPRSAHRWLYRMPLCRLGDFALGVVAARVLAIAGDRVRAHHGKLLGVALCSVVGLMCWPAHVQSAPSWDLSFALPATLLILCLAAAPRSWVARGLSNKAVVALGEASYALYLCHVYLLSKLTPEHVPEGAWYLERALTIAAIVVMAIGLHVAIERPARRFLRHWLDGAAPGPASAAPLVARDGHRSHSGFAAAVALASVVPALLLGGRLAQTVGLDSDLRFQEHIDRAMDLIGRGESRASLEDLAAAEELRPGDFTVYNNRCIALANLHLLSDALRDCRRAVDADPTSILARNNLGWVQSLPPEATP